MDFLEKGDLSEAKFGAAVSTEVPLSGIGMLFEPENAAFVVFANRFAFAGAELGALVRFAIGSLDGVVSNPSIEAGLRLAPVVAGLLAMLAALAAGTADLKIRWAVAKIGAEVCWLDAYAFSEGIAEGESALAKLAFKAELPEGYPGSGLFYKRPYISGVASTHGSCGTDSAGGCLQAFLRR